MRISKFLLLGMTGAALFVIAKRLINVERDSAQEDDLHFDADFIPGSKKLNLDIPEHVNPSWFRAPQRHVEDTDAMFI
jgi:hypothetical protein